MYQASPVWEHSAYSFDQLFPNTSFHHLTSHGTQHIPLVSINNIVHFALRGNCTSSLSKQPFPIHDRLKFIIINADCIRIHSLILQILDVVVKQFIQRLGLELTTGARARLAKVTPHNSHSLQLLFRNLFFHHFNVNTVDRKQSIHCHWSILPDTMAPIHGLTILMRIPIGIKDDARVSRGQVDSQPSRTCAKEEYKVTVVAVVAGAILPPSLFSIIDVHLTLTFVNFSRAVNAAIFPLAVEEVILDDVKQGGHLTKDENLVFVPEQSFQHAIQQCKLAAGTNKQLRMSTSHVRPRCWIDRLAKHERMVAILTMIHLLIRLTQCACGFNTLIEKNVTKHSLFNHFGVSILQFGHASIHDHFLFRRHVRQHILLDTAQQEWSEDIMQLRNRLILSLSCQNILFRGRALRLLTNVAKAKPRLKDAQIVKDGGVNKVEKTPQFIKVVLNGRTTQQQTISRFDSFEGLNECASMIFESLSLIHHQIRVLSNFIQPLLVANCHLVTGNNNGKIRIFLELGIERSRQHGITFFGGAVEPYDGVGGEPFLEFAYPIGKGGEGGNDDKGSGDVHCTEMCDQGDDLDCFSQSHLICQYSTNPILIQANQPPHTLQLIILQRTPRGEILRLNENRLPPMRGVVLILCRLQIDLSLGGFSRILFALLLALFRISGGSFFALFFGAARGLFLGLGCHVGLKFVDVGGDEVGVFFGTA
mmetsp:Transcript_24744/g.52487  ORF Transcript_24744/g.52487 Transcript_24744/m.52487 type:complete len:705 (-) Transcript_24744:568-2682(-)